MLMILRQHAICFAQSQATTPFFFNVTATTEIYTLSLHDALPISEDTRESLRTLLQLLGAQVSVACDGREALDMMKRSEEHTSELQSLRHLVCRLLLEKKKE